MSAGLAESVFESHIRCEAARDLSARAALLRLEALTLRTQSQASRRQIAELRKAIVAALGTPAQLDQPSVLVTTVVTVDDDPSVRLNLARAFAAQSVFRLLGEGGSGMEAVALTSIEQPQILVMADDMPQMSGVEAIRFVRWVAPRARICLYGDGSPGSDQADLVIAKSVSPPDLVNRLMDWAA